MAAFTVIMDFRGGTYVSQVLAGTPAEALLRWATDLEVQEIYGIGRKLKAGLVAQASQADLVPLNGMWSVWCTTFSLPSGSALVNVVRTALQ